MANKGEINPFVKGNKIHLIMGLCNIREFYNVNEALEENSIIFLNLISDIVHKISDKF